jgi:hypothetical protein
VSLALDFTPRAHVVVEPTICAGWFVGPPRSSVRVEGRSASGGWVCRDAAGATKGPLSLVYLDKWAAIAVLPL